MKTIKRQLVPACVVGLLLPCVAAVADAQSKSPLSTSSARNIIRRMAGIELPSSAVRIESVSASDRSTVDVLAQIETAFRFVKEQERWRVAEVRTGNSQWEETALILHALNIEETMSTCAETITAEENESGPGVREARCLIAQLAGVEWPSNSVRVKSVSPLSLPLSNAPSALVEAQVDVGFRLLKGTDGKWRVAEVRTGNRRPADVALLASRLNEQKKARALDELEALAAALEAFRRERGFYVEAETEAAIVDQLNPRYLRRIIRIDPWHKPYQYEGTRNSYVLRSNGADGQPNTSDDIIRRNDER